MTKILNKKHDICFKLLVFLAIYSFSSGLFNNYRVLWMDSVGLSTLTISRVITIASIITALSLLFFSIRVSSAKLKNGIVGALILKMVIMAILIVLNNTNNYFFIKFLMFFDIAFTELIYSTIYPLMMNVSKNDVLYTKKEVVESIASKIGFFLVSFLLGKYIGNVLIGYNSCLFFSLIFLFFSFIVIMKINVESTKEENSLSIKRAFNYFNNHKSIYIFLLVSFFSSITWSIVTALNMLTLTDIIGFSTKEASYLVLILGILTNVLAILIVKYLKFKNDYLNIFMKYGVRLGFYFLLFMTNDKNVLLIMLVYLFLTDMTYNFVLSGFIVNNMDSEYTLIFNVLKYAVSLFGNGIGSFICGMTFNLPVKYIGLYAFIFGLVAYILANVAVKIKNSSIKKAHLSFTN